MKFRTSDGRKLTYRRMGTGPVLVCHPGGPGFSSSYFGDLAGLWEKFTLVMLNPRGTGGSDRPSDSREWNMEEIPTVTGLPGGWTPQVCFGLARSRCSRQHSRLGYPNGGSGI